MDTSNTEATSEVKISKDWWVAGYVTAGSIVAFSQQFKKSSLDELVIFIIAIGAGCLYHRLKRRIGIKNDGLRGMAAYFLLLAVSAFLVGFLTSLV